MRMFTMGLATGGLLIGGYIGWVWQDHITSGGHFMVKDRFYQCQPSSLK